MLVVWEGGSVALNAKPGRTVTLGRDPECDVVVPVPTVSRQHLRLRHDRGVWTVTDCGSTVGTRRQGRVIPPQQAVPLIDGDQLDLGAGVMAASTAAPASPGRGCGRPARAPGARGPGARGPGAGAIRGGGVSGIPGHNAAMAVLSNN
jgi:predicted component of type VI protein secretion system